ncbi:hypothetical protein SLEP1_g32183 [Rubroshorea leprosula]|uniref:Reverse transcriptase Ty1/copia-type domain-containing protein n=1 Tax=Rubroshorea leprosula TaxID=152421 RepID=A0AAV5KCJ6_9ROSI|nr:hypothetical protein SLEP1_g32183 [Rubroshorea leprosula]
MASESSTTITSPISTNAAIPIGQNTIITFNVAAHFPLKLTPSNYPSWRAHFLSILTVYKLTGYLNGSKPCPPPPTGEVPDSPFELWTRQDQSIRHAILTSNTRCEGRTVTEFLHQLKVLADELAAIDKPLTNDDLTVYVLNGIGLKFREIFASLRTRDEPLSFEELHDRLVAHEESMHREETRLENAPVTAHFVAMPIRKPAGILPLPQSIQPFGSGQHLAGGRGANNHITTNLSNLALHSEYNGPDELLIGDGSGYKFFDPQSNKIFISRHVIFHEDFFPFRVFNDKSTLPYPANPDPTQPQVSILSSLPHPRPTIPPASSSPASILALSSDPCPTLHASLPSVVAVASPLPDLAIPPLQDDSPPSACSPDLARSPPCSGNSLVLPVIALPPPSPSPVPSSVPPSPASPPTASASPGLALSSPLPPPPITHRTHPMITWSLNNIFKPKQMHLATKHPLPVPVEPSCVSQAVCHPHWRRAMSEEFDALVWQGTWDLVLPSPTQNVIGCKWVFRLKRGKNGDIERYKAWLVAKGFHQRPGHDYSNTFSPVIKPTTIRTVLTIVVSQAWSIRQLDVNNAFLHGKVEEGLYMAQLVGFIDHNLPHHVCKLKKALYGLKQAPRAWYTELKQFLLGCGLVNSRSDCSLFIYNNVGIVVYVLVYVDDILITGNSATFISELIHRLGQKFSLKDLSDLSLFLGVEAIKTFAGLFLSQHRYINDLMQKHKMDGAKPFATPMPTSGLSSQTNSPRLPDGTAYRQLIGSLQYLSLTRPDTSFAINKLSQYMHCPTKMHWQAVKRILRYLKNTMFHGLLIRPTSTLALHAFSDSDWAGDKDTRVSTTGYIVFLGVTPISWKASKQKAIARSSTEAEYRALAAASSELVWVLHLLTELGIRVDAPPVLYCDNVGATYLSSNLVMHSRMKHIAIDLHFICDLVDKKILHICLAAFQDWYR